MLAAQSAPAQHADSVSRSSTRERLLDAAARLIAERGYHRASLGDIARAAGLTTGAVYSTFGSKWRLLRAVVQSRRGALELVDGGGTSFDQQLVELASRLHTAASSAPSQELAVLQLETQLLALRDPDLLAEVVESARRERAALADQLAQQVSNPPLPHDQLAAVLVALAMGLQLVQLQDPTAVTESTYAAALGLLTCTLPEPRA